MNIYHPLTYVWQHDKLALLPHNMEGRNGRFNDGWHCESNGLDAHNAYQAQEYAVSLHRKETGYKACGAVFRGYKQVGSNARGAVQNATTRQDCEIIVLATAPRLLLVVGDQTNPSDNPLPTLPICDFRMEIGRCQMPLHAFL